jgi:hypothetical protein
VLITLHPQHLPPASHVQSSLAIVPYKGPATSAAVAKKGMSTMKKTAGIAAGIAVVAGTGTLIARLVKSHSRKKHHDKRALDESEALMVKRDPSLNSQTGAVVKYEPNSPLTSKTGAIIGHQSNPYWDLKTGAVGQHRPNSVSS